MANIIETIEIKTSEPIQIIDITEKVRSIVTQSEIKNGFVNIITNHTTTAINLNEVEEGLQRDMLAYLKAFAPCEAGYEHDKNAADGRHNAHSHLIAMFMNASESIPLQNSEMVLGKWQSIFFIELDGPRKVRKVTIQIVDC